MRLTTNGTNPAKRSERCKARAGVWFPLDLQISSVTAASRQTTEDNNAHEHGCIGDVVGKNNGPGGRRNRAHSQRNYAGSKSRAYGFQVERESHLFDVMVSRHQCVLRRLPSAANRETNSNCVPVPLRSPPTIIVRQVGYRWTRRPKRAIPSCTTHKPIFHLRYFAPIGASIADCRLPTSYERLGRILPILYYTNPTADCKLPNSPTA